VLPVGVWGSFFYQLQLAIDSVVRKSGVSITIVAVLSLAGGLWTFGVCRYLRHHGPYPDLSPALHQVDLSHGETPTAVRQRGTTHTTAAWATHTRVSFPEYVTLAGSGIPRRETGTFRSRLLVAAADESAAADAAQLVHGRFVNAPFFDLFAVPIGQGRGFSSIEETAGYPVVVLGQRLNRRLFADRNSVGRSVLVEGRSFRVVGVVRGDQPFRPTWDIAMLDADQDALYLPFAWAQRLRARPEALVHQSPVGPGFEDLLRSNALFVGYWAELPDAVSVASYRRYLDEHFARHGISYVLRGFSEWRTAFIVPGTRVAFLSFLNALLLAAGGFSTTRLLLTKRIGRRRELGIRRALGASRGSLFAGQMIEATLLSLVAAALGVLLAVPHLALFNQLVADADIPARLTTASLALGATGILATGLISALYPAWRASHTPPLSTGAE
jgi:putative ABC transport system permease protein